MKDCYITVLDKNLNSVDRIYIEKIEFLFDDKKHDVALLATDGRIYSLSVELCSQIGVQ